MTESARAEEKKPAGPGTDSTRRTGGFLVSTIIFLAACGAVGAGGYFFGWPYVSEQWSRFTDLEQKVQELTAAVERRPDDVAAAGAVAEQRTQSLLDAARRENEQTLGQLRDWTDAELAKARSQTAERMGRIEQQVDRLLAVDRSAWLGHEAAFLLRLASQRLLVARDVDAATALLAQADALLRQTNTPAYEAVRLAIAQDHSNLVAMPKVDEVGLYGRLAALIDQVERLQLSYEETAVSKEAAQAEELSGANQNWLDGAESSWHRAISKLSDYLVIRRSNEEITALMTPEWAALARQNLRMLLEQSQIAMLTANASLYQQSLARAAQFTRVFVGQDPDRAQGILNEIEALQLAEIAPALPDLVGSRSLLDTELKRLERQMAP
ncbi:MAG: uroporphyrinogen-III C-methyltransferase [Halieaceae bacterium]